MMELTAALSNPRPWIRQGLVLATLVLGACAPASRPTPPSPASQAAPCVATPAPLTSDRTFPPTKRREINGVSFAYDSVGEGIPLVFLHGRPADRRSGRRFEDFVPDAEKAPFRRIYVDLPGMGETPASDNINSVDDYAKEVAAFIDAESGGRPVALVGVSWGSFLALTYALSHPKKVAGMALVVPALDDPSPPKPHVIFSEPGVFDGEPKEIAAALGGVATVHSKAVRDAIKKNVLSGGAKADRQFMQRFLPKPYSRQAELMQVDVGGPVLILTGRQDSITGYVRARELSERLPRATYAVLDRSGHALGLEQNELFIAHTREWLARLRESLGGRYDASGR